MPGRTKLLLAWFGLLETLFFFGDGTEWWQFSQALRRISKPKFPPSLSTSKRRQDALVRSSAASAPGVIDHQQPEEHSLGGNSRLRLALGQASSGEQAGANRPGNAENLDLLDVLLEERRRRRRAENLDLLNVLLEKERRRRCRPQENSREKEQERTTNPRRLRPGLVRGHSRPVARPLPEAGDADETGGQQGREQRARAQGPLHRRVGRERVPRVEQQYRTRIRFRWSESEAVSARRGGKEEKNRHLTRDPANWKKIKRHNSSLGSSSLPSRPPSWACSSLGRPTGPCGAEKEIEGKRRFCKTRQQRVFVHIFFALFFCFSSARAASPPPLRLRRRRRPRPRPG